MARAKKYIVSLSEMEREQLVSITHNYRYSQRERDRAQMLLLSDRDHSDQKIAEQVGCHWMTVRNVRLRFCTQQQEADGKPFVNVKRAHQANRPQRAFDGEKEAQLVALVCSAPPDGASRWTLQLVKDRLIQMQVVENVGKETIRRTLKKRAHFHAGVKAALAQEVLVHPADPKRPLRSRNGRGAWRLPTTLRRGVSRRVFGRGGKTDTWGNA